MNQMELCLKARPVLLQLPLGEEGDFSGVVDLISGEALHFSENDLGRTVQRSVIPVEFEEAFQEARLALIEAAADFDDSVLADFLGGESVAEHRLREALRRGTIACRISPVLLGSALRNKGIQPLLDAVGDYLPSPLDGRQLTGRNPKNAELETVKCDPRAPMRALAFKVMSDEGRMLTYLRLYSGCIRQGSGLFNASRGCSERVGRLFRMHAHRREEIVEASAGDIVAVLGFRETLTGDTLCDPDHPLLLEGLSVPEPVVSVAVEPKSADDRERFSDAVEKLLWEDPTFRLHEDPETGQTIITGMGELHLEIIVDRLCREYGVTVKTGPPLVVYRETLRQSVVRRESFQMGANERVEVGEVQLRLTPLPPGSGVRISMLPPTPNLTPDFLATIEECLRQGCLAGFRTGYPLVDLSIEVLEIPFEPGLTSEAGIRAAVQRGLAMAVREGRLLLLEPLMSLELTVPREYLGRVLDTLQQKRGRVEKVSDNGNNEVLRATVPLAEMFGYMTELRSATRGRGDYTMEFFRFDVAPIEVQQRFGLT